MNTSIAFLLSIGSNSFPALSMVMTAESKVFDCKYSCADSSNNAVALSKSPLSLATIAANSFDLNNTSYKSLTQPLT